MRNKQIKAMAFDPGKSTGIAYYENGEFTSGLVGDDFTEVARTIRGFMPDVIVVEKFELYPSKAKHLAWNDMFPAQVIGVIRYLGQEYNIPVVLQPATIKKYSKCDECPGRTQHEKDAHMHLWFYLKKKRLI